MAFSDLLRTESNYRWQSSSDDYVVVVSRALANSDSCCFANEVAGSSDRKKPYDY
jgi:hypothetical protein